MPDNDKPLASLSLDLDNQWSYMKTHGDPGWESFPSYLDVFVPHVLEVLERLELKITFFIVGQDAALEKNHRALRMIGECGHEVGNHSFHHEQWIHMATRKEIEKELLEAGRAISTVTGQSPLGFRGPGFSWNPDMLELLDQQGYVYDSSTFPTWIGPLARLYYFRKTSISDEDREKRKDLFGGFREAFRSVKPYQWGLDTGRKLLEIPVTTMPLFKIPFHLSYLLYLRGFSRVLMLGYLKFALMLCRITGTQPSFLLHPLDLLGGEQVPELAFFPGMNKSAAWKEEVFTLVIAELQKHFTLVPMGQHAKSILEKKIPTRRMQQTGPVKEAVR